MPLQGYVLTQRESHTGDKDRGWNDTASDEGMASQGHQGQTLSPKYHETMYLCLTKATSMWCLS